MAFQEDGLHPRRNRRVCQNAGALRATACCGTGAARQLRAVRDVKAHRRTQRHHVAKTNEVSDQAVVTKERAALREHGLRAATFRKFGEDVAHLFRSHELPLLDIDGLSGRRRGCQQIRLSAQECGHLQQVDHARHRLGLRRVMDIGGDRNAEFLTQARHLFHATLEPRAAMTVDTASVGLVEACLEYVGQVQGVARISDHGADAFIGRRVLQNARTSDN